MFFEVEAGVCGERRCWVDGVEWRFGRGGVEVVGRRGKELEEGRFEGVSSDEVEDEVEVDREVGREGVEVEVERYILLTLCAGREK